MMRFNKFIPARKTLVSAIVFLTVSVAQAYDFSSRNSDGQTIYYNIMGTSAEVTYGDKPYAGHISIPEQVTANGNTYNVDAIGQNAFADCTSLVSVTMPDFIFSIGSGAFSGCKKLNSVNMPSMLFDVSDQAFAECYSLQRVDITDIANFCCIIYSGSLSNPLYYAHHLYLNGEEVSELEIPSSVNYIAAYSFIGCSSLKKVVIPSSVTSIDSYAFFGCDQMKELDLASSVTMMGDHAFERCTSLLELKLPDQISTIESNTFQGCSGLETLEIPASVKTVGGSAFTGCSSLKTVISHIESPTTIGILVFPAFDNSTLEMATLYVPEGKKSVYAVTDGWKFINIEEGMPVKFTLTSSKGGSISYKGDNVSETSRSFYAPKSSTLQLTVTPLQGYSLKSLMQNANNVTAKLKNGSISFSNVTADFTLTATFSHTYSAEQITMESDMQTYCSASDLDFSSVTGIKAYIASGFNPANSEIVLTPVEQVPAGTGLLLKGTAGTKINIPYCETTFVYNNLLKGTTESCMLTNGYVLNGTQFIAVNGSMTLEAYKAYLPLSSTITYGAKRLAMKFTDNTELATSIEGVSQLEMPIISKNGVFDLMGNKLSKKSLMDGTLPRGIYIINGRKVAIK